MALARAGRPNPQKAAKFDRVSSSLGYMYQEVISIPTCMY